MRDCVYTNVEPVVMEYVALDDDSQDPDQWSANFTEAVAAYLALLAVPSLLVVSGSKGPKVDANSIRDRLEAQFRDKLSDAKLRDAIQQEPKRLAPGRFLRARLGSSGTSNIRRFN